MASPSAINAFVSSVQQRWEAGQDPRTRGLPIMDSLMPIATLIGTYLLFVLRVGPAWMRSRKPFAIQWLVRSFNAIQIACNVYFCVTGIHLVFHRLKYALVCEPPKILTDADSMKFFYLCYFYLWVRISDFLDTVFFVLAKKDSHVTFLHVYHHVFVASHAWLYFRQGFALAALFPLFLNSGIHIVMYTYFLLATFPQMKPHLWWKKYLTALQISQFIVVLFLGAIAVHRRGRCNYSPAIAYYCLANVVLFLVLFSRFYLTSYMHKEQQRIVQKGTDAGVKSALLADFTSKSYALKKD